MPTNIAIATARRSASASRLYSLLQRAPPTRLRDPSGRRTRRPSHVKTSPAREPPSSWPAPPYAAVAAAAEHQCMGSPAHSRTGDRPCRAPRSDPHPISSRNRHSPTTCSGRTKLLHRQGSGGATIFAASNQTSGPEQHRPRRRGGACCRNLEKRASQGGAGGRLPRAALPPACPAGPGLRARGQR